MAEPTDRGLTPAGVALDDVPLRAPKILGGQHSSDYEDFSMRVLALGATRNATTKKLAASDLATKVTLADNANWQVLEWDPEAGLIVIVPDAAINVTTDPAASKGSHGFPIAANAAFPLHVAGSPVGRLYVRRNAAGQPNINGYGFGSRNMAFASRRAFNTASSQTA